MAARLTLVRSPLTRAMFDALDRSGHAIACSPASVEEISEDVLELIVDRRSMLIVCLDSAPPAPALAAALLSDLFAIRRDAEIGIDLSSPHGMAGLVWRIGRGAIPLFAMNDGPLGADDLIRTGVADALVPEGSDPLEWVRSWLGLRSVSALASAARLVRSGGGEDAERAEFARLFAAGIPREGLSAFLERRTPRFENELIVETI